MGRKEGAADRRALRFAISAFCFLLPKFQLCSMPARARAAETLQLERTLSNLVNQACGLTRS